MNKPRMAIVDVGGTYLGDIDLNSQPQFSVARALIQKVRESRLTGRSSAMRYADELHTHFSKADLTPAERKALSPMVGGAIKLINAVGPVSSDAESFYRQHTKSGGGMSTKYGPKSGIYNLANHKAAYQIDDTPAESESETGSAA